MKDQRNKQQLEGWRAIEQERADQALERHWRERVAANERRRLEKRVAQFLAQESNQ